MKAWLEGIGLTESEIATGQTTRKLQDIRGGTIPPVVFKVLRWIITSNTSYLREIEDTDELIPNVSKRWRQYRFLQASPQREALYQQNVAKMSETHKQLQTYPDIYAFHGSPVANCASLRLLLERRVMQSQGTVFCETVCISARSRMEELSVSFAVTFSRISKADHSQVTASTLVSRTRFLRILAEYDRSSSRRDIDGRLRSRLPRLEMAQWPSTDPEGLRDLPDHQRALALCLADAALRRCVSQSLSILTFG